MESIKKRFFRGKDKNKENQTINEISLPTNVVRGIHVSKNQQTGEIEGLPKAWTRLLKSTITEDEQAENPAAGKWSITSHTIHMIHSSPTCKLAVMHLSFMLADLLRSL